MLKEVGAQLVECDPGEGVFLILCVGVMNSGVSFILFCTVNWLDVQLRGLSPPPLTLATAALGFVQLRNMVITPLKVRRVIA